MRLGARVPNPRDIIQTKRKNARGENAGDFVGCFPETEIYEKRLRKRIPMREATGTTE